MAARFMRILQNSIRRVLWAGIVRSKDDRNRKAGEYMENNRVASHKKKSVIRPEVVILFLLFSFSGILFAEAGQKPKLTVFIIVDGLSSAQFVSALPDFNDRGIGKLIHEGAFFENAHYGYAITHTAPGHATILTGAYPMRHGIVANYWIDRITGERTYCVRDEESPIVDEGKNLKTGVSAGSMLAETIGERDPDSRAFAISLKDRSAILSAGRRGKAFFYDEKHDGFITSTYYLKDYPRWWKAFYTRSYSSEEKRPLKWMRGIVARVREYFPFRPETMDHKMNAFAEAMIKGESIGRNPHGGMDYLILSYSALDKVNHVFGPESGTSGNYLKKLNLAIDRFLKFIDNTIGFDNTLIIMTSDHGFMMSPEFLKKASADTGRIYLDSLSRALDRDLEKKFGVKGLVFGYTAPIIYYDHEKIRKAGLDVPDVDAASKESLKSWPGVRDVFFKEDLSAGSSQSSRLKLMAKRSWNNERAGDVYVVQKRDWLITTSNYPKGTSHGSPYNYDTHVPLVFFGKGVKPGRYEVFADIVDIAPTVAALNGIGQSSYFDGKPLEEIYEDDHERKGMYDT